jgi:Uncharacterized protein conserved in bacteria C-term(DUF2220)/Uncharacterized protein conserved in bacteria N-term (DUF3322)/Putative exonuclease SbcCD, C subunit
MVARLSQRHITRSHAIRWSSPGGGRYRWVGHDNSALRAELEDELGGLRRQFDDVTRHVEIAGGLLRAQQGHIDELNRLTDDLSWDDLDLEPTTRRLAALADELDRADTPEQRARRTAFDAAQQRLFDARSPAEQAEQNAVRLNRLWGAVLRVQDAANDIVDATSRSRRTSWQQPRPCRSKHLPWTRLTLVEASFRRLRKSLERLADPSRTGESWRRSVFDSREHVTFRAIESPSSGKPVVHEGVSGMSGGEGQELIAFILGAALRYRLGEGGQAPPTYGCVVLDEHPGVTLRDKKIHTKFGDQPVYTHLDMPDTHTLASLNTDTAAHWQRARDRWDQLSRHHPGQAVQPWLARIVDLDHSDFTTLLAATTWFRANPRSGLTVRSVPVPGMHTKWLARHRSMVIACRGTLTDPGESAEPPEDPDPADIPDGDLDALGLRPLPREISIVIADPVLRAATGGLRQITAPVNELAALQIQPDTILIVENKEPAVTWSDTTGLVVIHSLGNHLDVLSLLPWICPDSRWYWGDLDRHGFTLLSCARTVVPQLESLLMTCARSSGNNAR